MKEFVLFIWKNILQSSVGLAHLQNICGCVNKFIDKDYYYHKLKEGILMLAKLSIIKIGEKEVLLEIFPFLP